ncbi:fimbrial protein [Paenalcaligenes sp. Me52]|uniref:fimbrial protein n=1 Tax=Paenalcaligenes sp. Me52 TaxID=3392038 RepID=UPI003D26E6EF
MRIISAALAMALGSCILYAPHVAAQSTIAGCDIHTNQLPNKYDPYDSSHYRIILSGGWSTNVSVPIDAAIGSTIHRITAWVSPDLNSIASNQKYAARFIPLANCPAGVQERFMPTGTQVSYDVFRHNLSTIGVRTYYPYVNATSAQPGMTVNISTAQYNMLYFPFGQAVVEFVLLNQNWGASSSQLLNFPANRVATTTVAGWGADQLLRYEVPSSIRFTPEPCKFVTDKNMTQDLNPVDSSLFTSVGTTLEPKRFSLRMQCNSTRPKPKVTFSGTAESATLPGVLKNQATTNPASGVGILLEHIPPNGSPTPVPLGSSSGVTTLVNNGSCGGNTSFCEESQINLQASYYSTAATVTPGTVLSRVTVTVEHM